MKKRRFKPIVAAPFLKWAGGKSWLLDVLRQILPTQPVGYREVFLGGGAAFFGLYPAIRPARLSDTNARLIDTYIAIRDCVEAVIGFLAALEYEETIFYAIRARFNEEDDVPIAVRAAWFIYLNRCCVNGLYRENADGEFNVSFGSYTNPTICNAELLRACSLALQGVNLRCLDFAAALDDVLPGEVVYLDPPYIEPDGVDSFTAYRAGGFSQPSSHQLALLSLEETDQERVVAACRRLDARGIKFVASNSDTPLTRTLYQGFALRSVLAPRRIGCGGDRRQDAAELLITNLELAA